MTDSLGAVLSIQSQVAFGHVGNSAALLPLQRLGFDVWPVGTVHLGHHPGYGAWRGYRVLPSAIGDILAGIGEQAPLKICRGLLSGYLGDPAIAPLIIDLLPKLRAKRPDLIYVCDPVIGDDGKGRFVDQSVAEAIGKTLIPVADVLTPNRFELAYLSGIKVEGAQEAVTAARSLLRRGPRLVIATGLETGRDHDEIGIAAVTMDDAWLVTTPRIDQPLAGTGDTFAALYLGHHLMGNDTKTALELASSAMFALVELTARLGRRELALIAAQDLFKAPKIRFEARRVV